MATVPPNPKMSSNTSTGAVELVWGLSLSRCFLALVRNATDKRSCPGFNAADLRFCSCRQQATVLVHLRQPFESLPVCKIFVNGFLGRSVCWSRMPPLKKCDGRNMCTCFLRMIRMLVSLRLHSACI